MRSIKDTLRKTITATIAAAMMTTVFVGCSDTTVPGSKDESIVSTPAITTPAATTQAADALVNGEDSTQETIEDFTNIVTDNKDISTDTEVPAEAISDTKDDLNATDTTQPYETTEQKPEPEPTTPAQSEPTPEKPTEPTPVITTTTPKNDGLVDPNDFVDVPEGEPQYEYDPVDHTPKPIVTTTPATTTTAKPTQSNGTKFTDEELAIIAENNLDPSDVEEVYPDGSFRLTPEAMERREQAMKDNWEHPGEGSISDEDLDEIWDMLGGD